MTNTVQIIFSYLSDSFFLVKILETFDVQHDQ